jgi:iron complex transport system substrate-binding protein
MEKKWICRTACAICIAVVAACSRKGASLEDYEIKVYAPAYASGFDILGAEGRRSVLVDTHNPWQGAEGVSTRLFIAREGEAVPEGFDGQVLQSEARRIVCMSSTHVAMLDAVGAASCIVGVSGIDFISNAYVTAHRDIIGDVGYDGNMNYELLVSLDPDLALLYGMNGASGMEAKLRELGIPFAYVGEYLEESPLGKAEWLVALAEMTGKREEGERVFAGIPERYDRLKAVAQTASARPKVMLNVPYGDSWFMASTGSYVARLIADAGGDYIYTKNTSNRSEPIDLEEAWLLASEADKWINTGSLATLAELKRRFPKFAGVRCVKAGEVYNHTQGVNVAGGNDYWESGAVRPDLVLQDLINIFHPGLSPDRAFTYYRRLD